MQQVQQRPRARGDQEVRDFEIQLARLHAELAQRDVELARRDVQYARHLELARQSDSFYIALQSSTADRDLRQRILSLQTLTFELEQETQRLRYPRFNLTGMESGTHLTSRASEDGRVGNVGQPGQPQAATMGHYHQAPPYRAFQTPPPTYEEAFVSGSASTSREQQ